MTDWDIKEIDERIHQMRQLAEELRERAGGVQAVERNLVRILASIKMLELNISDAKELV